MKAELASFPRNPPALEIEAETCRQAAHQLKAGLLAKRKPVRDGSITWPRPDRRRYPDRPAGLVTTGPGLFDGIPGVAIFLAAMAKLEGDEESRAAAWQALDPWRRLLLALAGDPERARRIRFDIGGLDGLGSFVYSLVKLSELLEAPELLDEAARVATLFTAELIAADTTLDLVSGAGGAVLTLLELHRHLPAGSRDFVLELATACADHLLARAVEREDHSLAWITHPAYPPLNGFAHGAAGLACALLQAHRATGAERFRAGAAEALRFERSTFCPQTRNWRDQTGLAPSGYLDQWCYGAPGIALARLRTLAIADSPEIRREIADGLNITDSPGLAPADHWCCGEFGRIEVLLLAAERLGEPARLQQAQLRTRRLLDRRGERGRFHGIVDSAYPDPTLFGGHAGIGYTLLRLAHPGRLPCILALE